MTDDAAGEAARKELRAALLKVWHKHEHKFDGLDWVPIAGDVEDAMLAHTEAALKEKETDRADYEIVVSESSYRTQAEIEDLHTRLAAAETKYHDAMEILSRWGNLDLATATGKVIEAERERDALKAAVEQARQALEAARDFIGNGYQPPELIAQIHAALTASAPGGAASADARRQIASVLTIHYGAANDCAVEDLLEVLSPPQGSRDA